MIGLISKQDAINAVSEYTLTHTDLDADKLNGLVNVIMKLPEPPIRHGHWIYFQDDEDFSNCGYKCSECGSYYLVECTNPDKYCPHCGTLMEEAT